MQKNDHADSSSTFLTWEDQSNRSEGLYIKCWITKVHPLGPHFCLCFLFDIIMFHVPTNWHKVAYNLIIVFNYSYVQLQSFPLVIICRVDFQQWLWPLLFEYNSQSNFLTLLGLNLICLFATSLQLLVIHKHESHISALFRTRPVNLITRCSCFRV